MPKVCSADDRNVAWRKGLAQMLVCIRSVLMSGGVGIARLKSGRLVMLGRNWLVGTSASLLVTSALLVVTRFATRNKCIASSNKCLTSSNKVRY